VFHLFLIPLVDVYLLYDSFDVTQHMCVVILAVVSLSLITLYHRLVIPFRLA
jgi:hypothetical protein